MDSPPHLNEPKWLEENLNEMGAAGNDWSSSRRHQNSETLEIISTGVSRAAPDRNPTSSEKPSFNRQIKNINHAREKQKQIEDPVERGFIVFAAYYYRFSAFHQREVVAANNLAQTGGANGSRWPDTITPGYRATLLHGPARASLGVM